MVELIARFPGLRPFRTCLILTILGVYGTVIADDFGDRLEYLRQADASDVGRDQLLEEYLDLLKDHPQHPDAALASLDIARLWEQGNPNDGMVANSSEAEHWLRRSLSQPIKSPTTKGEAVLALIGHIKRKDPDEARTLCRSLLDRDTSSLNIQARALAELVDIDASDGHFAEAQTHLDKLIGLYTGVAKAEGKFRERRTISSMMRGATGTIISRISSSKSASADRRAMLDAFQKRYSWIPGVNDQSVKARMTLDIVPDATPIDVREVSSRRTSLLVINAGIIIVLLAVIIARRYLAHGNT